VKLQTLLIIVEIIAAVGIPTFVSGFIVRAVNKHLDKRDKHDCDYEIAIRHENIIVMRNLPAIGHLAEATAYAQRDGHTNGRMSEALEYYVKARDETNEYLLQQNAAVNH
jgi:hypothetical protein